MKSIDLNRATELTDELALTVDDLFAFHPWAQTQTSAGHQVRNALAQAVKVIIAHVPPSPDRSAAIRKIREARMDCNSAITHAGKY